MTYGEFEDWLRAAIDAAPASARSALAADTTRRLLRDDLIAEVLQPEGELTPRGWQLFHQARRAALAFDLPELVAVLPLIDAEVLTDGNMDACLLFALLALDYWADFASTSSREALFGLALNSFNEIDFHVSVNIDHFDATVEIQAEMDRTARLLRS